MGKTGKALPVVVLVVAILCIATSLLTMMQISRWNNALRDSFVEAGADQTVDISKLGEWVSYPTDTKGQRMTVSGAAVSLADMRKEAKQALGDTANDSLDVTFKSLDGKELSRTMTRAEYETLRYDIALYETGRSCSADLEASVWNSQTVVSLGAGVLLIAWSTVLFVNNKKQSDQ